MCLLNRFLILDSSHIAALFLSSTITFIIGFALNRYVVFTESYLRGRIQLFRYFISFAFNLVVNYGMLKLLVELLHWNALVSQVITIALVISISYITQRHFTFRIKKEGIPEFTDLE
jgi:putative flippase GtrA